MGPLMATPLLISDSNILIDFDCCGLLPRIFKLPYEFAVPDLLYIEELAEHHPELPALGLKVIQFGPQVTVDVMTLRRKYPGTGFHDITALALAQSLRSELLTGDKQLRRLAEAEQQPVRGTVWLIQALIEHKVIKVDHALAAVDDMKAAGRRLPWKKAKHTIETLRK